MVFIPLLAIFEAKAEIEESGSDLRPTQAECAYAAVSSADGYSACSGTSLGAYTTIAGLVYPGSMLSPGTGYI